MTAVPRSPLRRWSIGHLAVALAALLAFSANLAYLRSLDDGAPLVVAARAITAGTVITAGDLTTASIRADPSILAALVTSVGDGAGRVARRDLAPGELVAAADLLAPAAPHGLRSMAIPIEPAHAAGGRIGVGDRVDVVDVDREGGARYVVRGAPVLAVSEDRSGALSVSSGRHLVLGVTAEQALELAAAIADGKVDVIVSTGADGG